MTRMGSKKRIHLDFGCGASPRNPFNAEEVFAVDIRNYKIPIKTKIIKPGQRIPFSDNYFDSVSAYDVLEHLSRNQDGYNHFIYYMNELCRVLKPQGLALFVFPSFPNKDAFSDPTHVNYITDETVNYFVNRSKDQSYEGIFTNYTLIKNAKLRSWNKYIYEAELLPNKEFSSLRRKISLLKRSMKRLIKPQHRIWILQKYSD
jgi:SAM-dependent methyltransferase